MINNSQCVIVLHGLIMGNFHTMLLARAIKKRGFKVFNIYYPSAKYDFAGLTDFIFDQHLQKHDLENTYEKVHFVGYSMGGLLCRTILNKYRINNVGNVIQIGTPNKGSEMADFLQDYWLYSKLFSETGRQLSISHNDDLQVLMGEVYYDIYGIAGDLCLDPITRKIFAHQPNDGKVSVASTQIAQLKQHFTFKVPHSFMPYSSQVRDKVLEILT